VFVRPFEYLTASSIEEASAILGKYGTDAKILAGGQSLMPMINLGLAQVDAVIDILSIPGLDEIANENGSLRIGALARHRTVELDDAVRLRQPLLAEAVRHVGNPRVRNLGTLGGSLAHNDPASELPLVMAVAEAEYQLSNGRETRCLHASEFSISYFTTALRDDEILVSVSVPNLPVGWGWGFHELAHRKGDFAIVAAAALACCRDGAIQSVRVALAGAGDCAARCHAYERAATGTRVDRLQSVAEAIKEDIAPLDDGFAGTQYRTRLAMVLATRAVQDACNRSRGGAG
jgi:aerobic carbon-monoxide dehydrogenase medium subunit